jgi:hypothetical protein
MPQIKLRNFSRFQQVLPPDFVSFKLPPGSVIAATHPGSMRLPACGRRAFDLADALKRKSFFASIFVFFAIIRVIRGDFYKQPFAITPIQ